MRVSGTPVDWSRRKILTVTDRNTTVLVTQLVTPVDARSDSQGVVQPSHVSESVSTSVVTTEPAGRLVGQIERDGRVAQVVQTTDVGTSAHLGRVSTTSSRTGIHGDVVTSRSDGGVHVVVSTETVDSGLGHGPSRIPVDTSLKTGLSRHGARQERVECLVLETVATAVAVASSKLQSVSVGLGVVGGVEEVDDVLATALEGRFVRIGRDWNT